MPSSSENSILVSDNDDEAEERLKRGCESFFAMKGAAIVLPHSKDTKRPIKKHPGSDPSSSHSATPIELNLIPSGPPLPEALVGELQQHLQCIFWILRPEDTIKMAVRLESSSDNTIRYMVLVSCLDTHQNTEETIILGMDIIQNKATIGLVLPIWADSIIQMDGDGGFSVTTGEKINVFKPVSIQAMWSALQALYRACNLARVHNYFIGGLHMTWIGFYQSSVSSPYYCLKEWEYLPDMTSPQSDEINYLYHRDRRYCPTEDELIRRFIFVKLKEIMIQCDLETVTSKMVRISLEKEIGKELKEYKRFIDKQILLICGQLDSASKIFDHIYLGSEWNASDLDELEENGVGYILNITKECDNFFPERFKYCNIRLYDDVEEDLLNHWNTTYLFLSKAKEAGSKALVHCKMGISRSASTVIAYAMKEYGMTLEYALDFVKAKRSIIRPNDAFMKQLQVYEGILEASRQRHTMFRSKSESSLSRSESVECLASVKPPEFGSTEDLSPRGMPRNKSFSVRERKKKIEELDSPEGAVGGPSFFIGPDPTHLGAGKYVMDTGEPLCEGAVGNDPGVSDCNDFQVLVPPTVRPSSIVKLQKEGALALGDVPFVVATEPAALSSTVLSSSKEPVSSEADTVEGSSMEDTMLNTNNNSANELSLDGSDEDMYQRTSVKSKVTEIESSVMGAMDATEEEGEGEGESEVGAYKRESIPWNPGTVLRQKQEIEEKMRDGSPTSSVSMKFDDEGEEGDEEGRSETQVVSIVDELASSATGSTQDDLIDSPGTNRKDLDVNRTEGGECEKNQQDGENRSVDDAENASAPMDVTETTGDNNRSSVYTTSGEEIQLSMGLVERHKREFEQKTAAEVLQQDTETDAAVDDATDLPCGAQGSPGVCEPLEEERMDVQEEEGGCTSTVYPDEASGWKVGDVRRHTMELEERMELASSPSPTKKSVFWQDRDGDEQSELTSEELRNIQEMDIPLRSSSPDGVTMDAEAGESEVLVGVAEQVKQLELRRCRSIAKMSNEKVKTLRALIGVGDEKPVSESSSSAEATCKSMADEPLVELNPDTVRLFTSQIGCEVTLDQKAATGERKTRKSESDKETPSSSGSKIKSQHGPSHPLRKLAQGGATGRGTRGKFYSTM
ncbi:uncharacterized protein LOC575378 isoform X1 [Strongylocentrotus purpuratus]|uniref:protein-serine/threonine phosphatase n=1 Tax=Strongylocentrotus purpuratus TaxID=7668 RepID=A0A7M7HH76_STRPU|nr:uncharacterized protein LOC575378 isoform X1 [Strongylocentrotus purpuratus]